MESKQQMIPVEYVPMTQCEEDSIDLRELVKTILKHKKFIIIFTLAMSFLAGVYVFVKTPIYETKSSVLIGQIDSKPIISPQNMKEYLNAFYEIELTKKFKQMPNAYVSAIIIPKKSDSFVSVKIDGLSNRYDLDKLNEVVGVIHNGFESKIKKYIALKKNEIKNKQFQIQKISNTEIPDIKMQIKSLQDNIKLQQNLIKYYNDQLKVIDQKIKFLQKNINDYKKLIDKLIQNNNNNRDVSSNIIISNKIISYQNIIVSYTNQIKDFNLQKNKIISQTIPQIYNKIDDINNQIINLQKSLTYDVPQKIKDLQNQIEQINLSLENTFAAKVVGKPIMSNHPIKPKKKLIITMAFITGFILSIFLVFFIEFVKGFKEEDELSNLSA